MLKFSEALGEEEIAAEPLKKGEEALITKIEQSIEKIWKDEVIHVYRIPLNFTKIN